jgi:hypothetical protein
MLRFSSFDREPYQTKPPTINAAPSDGVSLLADVATEHVTHPDESAVDVAGNLSHSSRSRQCNKPIINRY